MMYQANRYLYVHDIKLPKKGNIMYNPPFMGRLQQFSFQLY